MVLWDINFGRKSQTNAMSCRWWIYTRWQMCPILLLQIQTRKYFMGIYNRQVKCNIYELKNKYSRIVGEPQLSDNSYNLLVPSLCCRIRHLNTYLLRVHHLSSGLFFANLAHFQGLSKSCKRHIPTYTYFSVSKRYTYM